jgi:lipoprotein-releasing system ATP-binding protein
MNGSIIRTENVHKSYSQAGKQLNVIQGISTTFNQGSSYAIIGASGSGKSTLLHLLGGLDTPTSGKVYLDKQLHIGFVFQFHYLINELTVLENIMIVGMIKGISRTTSTKKAEALLEKVGLASKANSYPVELSGGEQQRVSILRAIFNEPHFLLADEPTGNLDAHMAQEIVKLLEHYRKEYNMGIILCSHDLHVYEKMEKIYELIDGKLIQKTSSM